MSQGAVSAGRERRGTEDSHCGSDSQMEGIVEKRCTLLMTRSPSSFAVVLYTLAFATLYMCMDIFCTAAIYTNKCGGSLQNPIDSHTYILVGSCVMYILLYVCCTVEGAIGYQRVGG